MTETTDTTPSTTEANGKTLADPRIKDAQQGHAIFTNLRRDDSEAAIKRANIDYQIDGGLPYDEALLIDLGRGDETNVNFMEARAEDDGAQTPYIEMTTVSRILWNCRTGLGDTTEQERWSRIISEEFTRTVREWSDFNYYRLRLAQQFTRHGVAFLYWEDEIDWRWRADGMAAFRIPRNIEARASAIPYATCEREMTVDELHKFIRNEKAAEEVGRWNVDAVKEAMIQAAPLTQVDNETDRWEAFMKRMRENDLGFAAACKFVKLYHLWVPEFDGSTSHYISLQSGPCKAVEGGEILGKGFLYEHRNRYSKQRKWIIPFFYGIGTHGTIHTIRANGELNFAPIAVSNRTRCGFIDAANASASIVLEAATPNDAESAAYIRRGPFTILSGNSKISATAMPDVSNRILPVLRDMQLLRQNVTPGSFQSRAITEEGSQERTKYEIQAQQQKGGTVESAQLTLFCTPLSQAGKEMFERMMNPDLDDGCPGGPEAFDFIKRVLKRGVPRAALDDVYEVEWVRSIGYGSAEARQYSTEKIYQMSGGFDAMGQRQAKLDMIASLPGVDYRTAEQYVGPEEPRQTVDDEIAELENNDFKSGQDCPVTSNQNHWLHCQHHAALLNETEKAFDAGEIDGNVLVPIYAAAIENMLAHAEFLNQDPMKEKEAAWVRKFVQNKSGTLEQQQNKIVAEMQRAQEEGQQQGGEPQDGEEQRKWEAHTQEMQMKDQEFQARQREIYQKLEKQEIDAQASRAERDLKLQADLLLKRAKLNGANA